MSLLLLLGVIAPLSAAPPACPGDASVRHLKKAQDALLLALMASPDQPLVDPSLGGDLELLLACTPDLPRATVARSFLLLGAERLAGGVPPAAKSYVDAAGLLGAEDAWADGLAAGLRTMLDAAQAPTKRPRGVVWAPAALMPGSIHLVGAEGQAPWSVAVGTFTFEWNDQTIPVSVNEGELSVVTPQTIREFKALVEGVTEADLKEPDFGAPIRYETRREERRTRRQEEPPPEQASSDAGATTPQGPGQIQGDDLDAEVFFDELSDMEDSGPPPATPEPPPPERTPLAVSLHPHLGAGGAWTFTGTGAEGAAMAEEHFGGPGVRAELGLLLSLGERLLLRPGLSFHTAASSADLGVDRFAAEGWGGEIPVEPLRNRLLAAGAELPVLLRAGPLAVGAGPAWSMAFAKVTGATTCDEGDCVAPVSGRIMAGGGTLQVGLLPAHFPLRPWLEGGLLHDGERPYGAAALVLSWEGAP
ncbi:MAG: hypothetical protein ABIO70_30745 [Pseudomonadota bacterium]